MLALAVYITEKTLNGTHQKLTARFLLSLGSGRDCTSCHQKAGMKRTSPGLRVHSKRRARANFGNLSRSGFAMSTGDITIDVLCRRVRLWNLPLVGVNPRIASGM